MTVISVLLCASTVEDAEIDRFYHGVLLRDRQGSYLPCRKTHSIFRLVLAWLRIVLSLILLSVSGAFVVQLLLTKAS
jgi:hypothetical protein